MDPDPHSFHLLDLECGSGSRREFFSNNINYFPPKNLKFKEKIQAKTDKMLGNC